MAGVVLIPFTKNILSDACLWDLEDLSSGKS